jgi:HPt (histidine-containing phosphotransfer) domain-containing protein
MNLLDELNSLGTDIDEAMGRFMGNAELLEMMYKKMPESIEKNCDVIPCIEKGDIDGAIQKAHTLKGNMGNLSITPLFEAYRDITNSLRAGNLDEAKSRTEGIQEIQNKIVETIKKYC